MGKIIIHEETTKYPITTIGKFSGICYGANTDDTDKNYKRGLENIKSNHGRTLEYVQVYITLDGYSAKVIREFYTSIGGSPTRLQASTRYINYQDGFAYVVPKSLDTPQKQAIYVQCMDQITKAMYDLDKLEVPREDSSMLLPLGMETKVVLRTNLRNLVDMSRQRMCSRAFWEYRTLMSDMITELSLISEEWKYITDNLFHPKCLELGYCPETHGCGAAPKKGTN